MENVSWMTMYLIAMLPNIADFFDIFFVLFALITLPLAGFYIFVFLDEQGGISQETTKKVNKIVCKKLFIFSLLSLLILGSIGKLIPDYKQLAFIVGGTWALNNENVRQMPDNIAMIVNQYLEEMNSEDEK